MKNNNPAIAKMNSKQEHGGAGGRSLPPTARERSLLPALPWLQQMKAAAARASCSSISVRRHRCS